MISLMFANAVASASNMTDVMAYGVDTIAGYSALITTSKTYPNTKIFVDVKKPDGAVISVPVITNTEGKARLDLYDYHTRKAGVYEVSAHLKGDPGGQTSTFKVYPDNMSADKSNIEVNKTILKADDEDTCYLSAQIVDKYNNPLSGHVLRVISSRSEDSIRSVAPGNMTDVNGSVSFAISSDKAGVSIYSLVDVTNGGVLSDRAEVTYLNSASYLDDAGGYLNSFIPVASAQPAGPLNKFLISGIPETVDPNTDISFTVTAQDQDELTVQNYTGTVHFSVEGINSTNVTLPEDYTFKAEDLGAHEFSLGLKFPEDGTYKLVATDINNMSVKGEFNVAVGSAGDSGSSGSGSLGSGEKPTITSPLEGTYSQNVQEISGKAAALSTVKIFDNDQEIGMIQSDSSGNYSFETTPLADGNHEIYVVWLDDSNEVQGTSDTVMISIDTTAPVVDDIVVDSSTGIKSGDVVNVEVYSEENLTEAALIFNLDIYQLSPSTDTAGLYIASFQAPETAGEYPVDVLLVDDLGNEATYQSVVSLMITENGEGSVSDQEETVPEATEERTDDQKEEVDEPDNEPPSQVFGVIGYGSDKRVTLVWEAATDDGIVDHYRIYYGTDPLNLDNVIDTKDAATTWYIPNLENGKEYFFAVSAVDEMDIESLFTSELVSAIPFTLEVQAEVTDRPAEPLNEGGQEALLRGAAIEAIPPEMVDNGPEILLLLAGTGVLSGVARRFQNRKKG